MFAHIQNFTALRARRLEVCWPQGHPYRFQGKTLDPAVVTACTCKRDGVTYQTACLVDGGLGVVENMQASASSASSIETR